MNRTSAENNKVLAKPKGFVFDYRGTIDTQGCHWGKMIWHAYERANIPVSEDEFQKAYVDAERTLGRNPIIQTSYTFEKTLRVKLRIEMDYLLENHCLQMDIETGYKLVDNLLDDLYERVCKTVANSKNVLTLLKKKFPLALVSNFYGNMGEVIKEFELEGLFEHIVESAVVGVKKPDPRIFQMGVEALGLTPADVVVVGDSFDKDILPAKKLGCRTIWIKGEEWTKEKHDENIPEVVIESLDEIITLFALDLH